MQSDLALAALDPNAAIQAVSEAAPVVVHVVPTMVVYVKTPPVDSRWRFLLFYLIVKLAARVYRFRFELCTDEVEETGDGH